jgi:hypothetical protein
VSRNNPEDQVHRAVLTWIRKVAPQCIAFHPANGGSRNRLEAIKLKTLGVVPGVPDLIVFGPGGKAYCLEVKAEKGTLQPTQKAFALKMDELGIGWALVRSVDDARVAFAKWGLVTREAGRAAA